MLLLPSDIISLFFCFRVFYELKLWTKAKPIYLYAVTTVWIPLTSCLEFNLSTHESKAWCSDPHGWHPQTPFPHINTTEGKRPIVFHFLLLLFIFITLSTEALATQKHRILLYDHMWKIISVPKNLCYEVRWKQQVKRKYKQSDIPKVKNGSVDLFVSLLESYLRQLLYKTWNIVCCTLQLLYYNYFENRGCFHPHSNETFFQRD